MRHVDIDFLFYFFNLILFGNGFSNSLIVRSWSSFCLVNKYSLNCTSRLVLLFLFCFWIGFFLNACPNPFIVHSRPSSLFSQMKIL